MNSVCKSCPKTALDQNFNIKLKDHNEFVVALAGNPNVGKSTVFNALTGLNQHTGNWPGKTVSNARGIYRHGGKKFVLVDLPGTYSLLANSVEEQVARDFICFGKPDATIVVADATCLERNLNIVLQIIELTNKVILCINLMDEAKRKGILVDIKKLEKKLGIPVVATIARKGEGLGRLMDKTYNVALGLETTSPEQIQYPKIIEDKIEKISKQLQDTLENRLNSRWVALRLMEGDTTILESIYTFMLNKGNTCVEKEGAYIYGYQ
ncbi:MAG TPA: FeoB small GTPase domain-containing protein [Clostridia bacterium]|nr:FeoB small GTPase domain-containing protein [Clostridia bacterium]